MAVNSVLTPFPTFFDATGAALENGFIYIGEPGFEARTTPKASYFAFDPLAIPTGTASGAAIRTKGGFPINSSNAPAMFYVDGDYSISICDRNGVLLYSALSMTLALNVGGAVGPVLGSDGNLGAVGIGFANEPNTGFVRSGANIMQTAVGGVLVSQQTPAGTVFQQPVSGAGFSSGVLAVAQPVDLDLTAIAALSSTGFAVRTAADTWAQRQITSTDGSVTITNPAGVAGDIDLSAARAEAFSPVVSLSGAAPITVTTAVPANCNYVELWFDGMSLNSTGHAFVQLGDTAFVTTGYDSAGNSNGAGGTSAAGLVVRIGVAAQAFTGVMVLRRTPGTNIWVSAYNGLSDGLASYLTGAGKVTLAAPLERIRVTATAANDFDGGTVYAVYR